MTAPRYFSDGPQGALVFDPAKHELDYQAGEHRFRPKDGGAWYRVTRTVRFARSPRPSPCDHRCTHATGRVMDCECRCGGANHGRFGIRRSEPTSPQLCEALI